MKKTIRVAGLMSALALVGGCTSPVRAWEYQYVMSGSEVGISRVLKEEGAKGWELASCVYKSSLSGGDIVCFLKRPGARSSL
jgi:hypothetical protein